MKISSLRDPSKNSSIDPQRNSMINPTKNLSINPLKNSSLNPAKNSLINPKKNSSINPFKNSFINPHKNSRLNPFKNSMLNPFKNSMINPYKTSMFKGMFLFNLSRECTGFLVEADERVSLWFDTQAEPKFFTIVANENIRIVCDFDGNWESVLVSNSSGQFNLFDLDGSWFGHTS
ncbi:hypothetical protein [Vibrio lentus]|uniref:hypothetical protein n=1 Tax=Vibrio lentus TaxID=136468 RepID=UPI001054795F|nr:hypothetical protein [Vibrio lentus]